MAQDSIPTTSQQVGFFRNGWRELGRRFERRKLRKQAHQLDQQRTTALGAAGQRAWQAKIDLSAFPDLRDQLARLDARTGELTSTAKKLGEEKASLEARRQAETARFDAARAAIEEKKRPVDVALKAAQDRLNEQNQTLQRLQARQAALPAERAAVEQQLATLAGSAAPDRAAKIAAAENRKQQLELEQKHMAERLALAQQGVPPLAAEVQRLFAESQRYAGEIQRVESERNSSLSPILAGLERVQRDTSTASQEASTVHQERQRRFVQLGLALYEAKVSAPPLAPTIEQVAAIDRNRAATQGALEASLTRSRTMPGGTMVKFWATVVLLPILVIGLSVVGYHLLAPSGRAPRAPMGWVEQEEARKDSIVQSFIQGRRDTSKRGPSFEGDRNRAIQILKEDMGRLGATGDPKYLSKLAKILGSEEPELKIAAAEAIRKIGPTSAEVPALSSALNDPAPGVRQACLYTLERAPREGAAPLLIRLALDESRPVPRRVRLQPEEAPDDRRLGVPIYPGATFLHFASNASDGRAAFATTDAAKQVLNFYQAKGQRGPMTSEEFGRKYLGASVLEPTSVKQMADQARGLMAQGITGANLPADTQNPAPSRETRSLQYLLVRYSDDQLYGSPAYIVTEETATSGEKKPVRFVVVFQDRSLSRTGLIIHFPPSKP